MNDLQFDEKLPNLTKIIITVSPSIKEIDQLVSFINQGVTIFRMNFSHGSSEEHKLMINNLRQASKKTNKIITICLDTKGQEFRISLTKSSEVNVKKNDILIFTNKKYTESIFIPVSDFSLLKTGLKFYLDDGLLALEVVELGFDHIKGKALNSHRLKNNKKVNFPGIELLSLNRDSADQNDILFGVKHDVDVIFASFVIQKNNVLKIKEMVGDIPVFSKIEAVKSIEKIDEIIEVSDGIMVARGDLGVETGFVEMFEVQKAVSTKCLKNCKPVICATQMLESMTSSTIPLRSEISDIGNAVLDEYDALMLSGETAVGKNPNLCCEYMKNIIKNAEKYSEKIKENVKCPFIGRGKSDSCVITEISNIDMIKHLYNKKLGVLIYIISDNLKLLSIANLYRGFVPIIKTNKTIETISNELKKSYGFQRILQFIFCDTSKEIKTINIL